jgi:GNAT superfamily N-acetyltransferase
MAIIFRRIGGRIVPIKIGFQAIADVPGKLKSFDATRLMVATAEGKYAGSAHFRVPKTHSVTLEDVRVAREYQRKGISKAMFREAMQTFGKEGKKFIRSNEIQHPAQVKIRSLLGKKTVYGVHGVGLYGEESRKITRAAALDYAKRIQKGDVQGFSQITATTMIPKKYRGK